MLICVMGASGVGKDALISGAKASLAGDPVFAFPQREITKPRGTPGEPFTPVDEATFERKALAGDYALSWRAHGYRYGVPMAAAAQAWAGKRVVVNVSRSATDQIRARFPEHRIVLVVARRGVAEARLRARGRESEAEIAERLAAFDAYDIAGEDVVVVRNDGPLDAAVAAFLAAVRS